LPCCENVSEAESDGCELWRVEPEEFQGKPGLTAVGQCFRRQRRQWEPYRIWSKPDSGATIHVAKPERINSRYFQRHRPERAYAARPDTLQLQALAEAGVISEEERRQLSQGNGGQLNPEWVEWLMGFPIGWTELAD
jgi:hypothetical protein